MEHVTRLQLVSRITYYLGWLAGALGALVQFVLGSRLQAATSISKRNLFEASLLFFIICIASELRARIDASSIMSSAAKRPAA